jgi:hypothetical protein
MYNIIESKYRYIFLICIIGILLFLFINSGAIVEGLSAKQKKAKKAAAQAKKADAQAKAATAVATAAATSAAATEIQQQVAGSPVLNETTTSGTASAATTATVKKEVKAQLPSLVSGVLAKPVTDIKSTQAKILAELRQVSTMQNDLKKNMNAVNTDMENTKNKYVENLKTTHDSLSKNLSQQYEMYKNGIKAEGSNATASIQNMNKSVSDASEQAIGARDKSKEYADLTNKIYNDVFGALTTRVIQQDNAEFVGKQGFTPMTGSGYITPDPSTNKNLFDLEKELVLAINDFNTSYYNFIRCSSGGSVNCGNNSSEADVNTKSDTVINLSKALQDAYNKAKTNINTNDGTFKTNHQEIMEKSKSIDELRRNLDSKMDAILKIRNPPNELTQQYDSTVYTGIMWSVLATSVLFYVFTEM